MRKDNPFEKSEKLRGIRLYSILCPNASEFRLDPEDNGTPVGDLR